MAVVKTPNVFDPFPVVGALVTTEGLFAAQGGDFVCTSNLVSINADDTTQDYLHDKIEAGSGISVAIVDTSGVKTLRISSSGGGGSATGYTLPITTGWTSINDSGATFSSTDEYRYIEAPANATYQVRAEIQTAPSTPWVLTAAILPTLGINSPAHAGLCFRDSATGEIVTFGPSMAATGQFVSIYKWNSATGFAGSSYVNTHSSFFGVAPLWLRIADDGTNRICSWSADGLHFVALHSVGRTDFLTTDGIGYFVAAASAGNSGVTLMSWDVS